MTAQDAEAFDSRFHEAVTAIDGGDLDGLHRLLAAHPELAVDRLERAGPWLRAEIGQATDGVFARPYLLWFVTEDVPRHGRLPPNIVDLARLIVETARSRHAPTLQEQLDSTLRLVCWSGVAATAGAQVPLIDLLVDAGAAPAQNADNALVNGHMAAAEHVIARGGELSLAAALCLGRWDAVPGLAAAADDRQKEYAFVLAALNGKADAVAWMVAHGAAVDAPSVDLYSHATPLHHAVCSGSLETVQALVDAGADLTRRDTAWNGTPLGWAEHYVSSTTDQRQQRYLVIADFLRRRSLASGQGPSGKMPDTGQ